MQHSGTSGRRGGGPHDTGLGDQLAERIEGFQEALRAAAGNVRDALAAARPDEVCVEFGPELDAGRHGIVAAVAGVDGEASFKIALKWTHGPAAPPGRRARTTRPTRCRSRPPPGREAGPPRGHPRGRRGPGGQGPGRRPRSRHAPADPITGPARRQPLNERLRA
ncbi:CU044_2847 family protein [Kitasatospora sp. NPDC057015]|uniref:CU044_2847 family protein n=1 Tax=Kitasatospora sp. NPDC057015 TaxID=3346001 RepID=UPI0036384C91